jgi:hypothetical protein
MAENDGNSNFPVDCLDTMADMARHTYDPKNGINDSYSELWDLGDMIERSHTFF